MTEDQRQALGDLVGPAALAGGGFTDRSQEPGDLLDLNTERHHVRCGFGELIEVERGATNDGQDFTEQVGGFGGVTELDGECRGGILDRGQAGEAGDQSACDEPAGGDPDRRRDGLEAVFERRPEPATGLLPGLLEVAGQLLLGVVAGLIDRLLGWARVGIQTEAGSQLRQPVSGPVTGGDRWGRVDRQPDLGTDLRQPVSDPFLGVRFNDRGDDRLDRVDGLLQLGDVVGDLLVIQLEADVDLDVLLDLLGGLHQPRFQRRQVTGQFPVG